MDILEHQMSVNMMVIGSQQQVVRLGHSQVIPQVAMGCPHKSTKQNQMFPITT